jgi:hypothetical protein
MCGGMREFPGKASDTPPPRDPEELYELARQKREIRMEFIWEYIR